ncbi:MAG: hypothetical protein NZO58_01105 [Gemmataceae bacterium]|nr:hypothetical protein [Gemmataceae bacterium]
MATDLDKVTRNHILRACDLFDAGKRVPKRQVHSLVVEIKGRLYPANFLLKVARELAGGDADDSSGALPSTQTIKYFRKLGFAIRRGPLQFINPATEVDKPTDEGS